VTDKHLQYAIKVASEDSVESLCALFQAVFNQAVKPSEWRWKYHDAALLGHDNVVLCDETGAAIGHAGAVIVPGVVAGRGVPVAQICDVMLSRAARGQAGPTGAYAAFMSGLFSRLQERIPEGLYYGFPGKRPFRLGERLGFYRGTGPIFESRLEIGAHRAKRWPWCRLSELAWDDPRIDRLWEARAARHPGIVVLDRKYLDWRYRRNPFHDYRLLGFVSGLQLTGWVVVSQRQELLRCVDRLLDDSSLNDALGLLTGIARQTGATQLAWWADGTSPPPVGTTSSDTQMIGTVVTASAPEFSATCPSWQPGNVDVF
jgi:hypothetical protein